MVGDSLGMVMQGHDSTPARERRRDGYHSRCVARGVKRALLVVDMPFVSYQQSPEQALVNAGRLMRKGGAQVVKLEGGAPMVPTVKYLTERGIPVCAHLGLTPQSVHQLGGYRVQGRDQKTAEQIRKDAKLLEAAGASLIVLEAMPAALAKTISQETPHPYHWHRRRSRLRRPDSGAARHAWALSEAAEVFQELHGRRRFHRQAVKNYVTAVKARAFPVLSTAIDMNNFTGLTRYNGCRQEFSGF